MTKKINGKTQAVSDFKSKINKKVRGEEYT